MKLTSQEIHLLVSQELRKIHTELQSSTYPDHEAFKNKAQWRIEHELRKLDATSQMPEAFALFFEVWPALAAANLAKVAPLTGQTG